MNDKIVEKKEAPSELITLAIEKGTDLDKLEKLLALKERWEANEAKKAYHQAMSEFKANPPKINKDKKVGYKTDRGQVGYSHASLANVTDKINKELSKYGLSASWVTKQNGVILVTCKITHIKGHSEETTLSAPADTSGAKNSIQAIGSTITYLERYTLLALTGLATFDQDDDGKASEIVYIDEKELSQLLNMIHDSDTNKVKFLSFMKIDDIKKLEKKDFQRAMVALEAKKKASKK
jgi:hypothetical protein